MRTMLRERESMFACLACLSQRERDMRTMLPKASMSTPLPVCVCVRESKRERGEREEEEEEEEEKGSGGSRCPL